jgi:hypothetical protein
MFAILVYLFFKFVFNTRRVFLPFDVIVEHMHRFKIASLTGAKKLRTCGEQENSGVLFV